MGSRIGSIAIFLVIFGIVAAVFVLILTLDVLNTNDPDEPLVVVSIDDGELVLLDDPQSITVTISSGNPIATLELFVNGESLISVLPSYSADRGAYIGTFVWTPSRLGFADLRIVALDAEGVETERQIRVEVTDDQARVAAALKLQVLGIAPLQQFITGAPIRIAISATGSQAIERFDMFVNGSRIVSVTPALVEGEYVRNIDWTPGETGEVEVTITAIDAAGREESLTIPIVLLPQGGAPASDNDNASDSSESESDSRDDTSPTGVGSAQIGAPRDGQRFTLGDAIDVEISAPNVTVQSSLLYLTPVAPDGTLGNSVLVHSAENVSAPYSEVIADVERWIASSGSYELQLVVFTPEDDRYDARVVIHVVAEADATQSEDEDAQQGEQTQPSQELSDEVDIAIVSARQSADDLARLNVSIINASTVDVERTDVVITVIDAATGAELGTAAVTLGMDAEGLRTIPLELSLQPSVNVDALVVLESTMDTDTSNNTFQISLAAPTSDEASSGQESEGDDSSESDDQSAPPETPSPSPDLAILDAQSAGDGFVYLTVQNQGDAAAASFEIVIADQDGTEREVVGRGSADDAPLAINATETLSSRDPHQGVIVITVVLVDDFEESNLANNSITLTLPE